MVNQPAEREAPTRRDCIKYGGVLVGGGLLAGCTAENDAGSTSTTATESETAGASTVSATESEPTATEDGSYSVTMEPVGRLAFDRPPETWVPFTGDYADMGVALGQAGGLNGIGVPARYASHHYDELPGVSVGGLTPLYNESTGKEVFYELDTDLHVIDPNFMIERLGWNEADVEEIRENVAPWFGNTGFTRVYDWHEYRYYSLYEAFEKLAAVFQERERFEAFRAYHDEVLADVRSRLPTERPDVAILYPADIPPESFYPYLVGDGYQSKQWRDLQVGDAVARNGVTDAQVSGGTIDYEELLEIDPDAIAIRLQGEITDSYVQQNVVEHMRQHDVASELTAVENDRVFYGGVTYQGPIIHLFQLERAARGLYPDAFDGEQLFDRQRVADIVNGEI
jgi:iron complex transport system substrate-binding protein